MGKSYKHYILLIMCSCLIQLYTCSCSSACEWNHVPCKPDQTLGPTILMRFKRMMTVRQILSARRDQKSHNIHSSRCPASWHHRAKYHRCMNVCSVPSVSSVPPSAGRCGAVSVESRPAAVGTLQFYRRVSSSKHKQFLIIDLSEIL